MRHKRTGGGTYRIDNSPAVGHVGVCDPHGKRLYTSRGRAKKAIREFPGNRDGLHAYRCDAVDGMWHIGRLPPAVRYGLKTTDEVYGEGQ